MKLNLKTETKDIDGLGVTCTQFPAMRSSELLARLLKVIGPSLGVLMRLDPNTELDRAGVELVAGLSSLKPEELPGLISKVLEMTAVRVPDESGGAGAVISLDKKENLDIVFSGRMLTMFKVAGFAIQVNYRDFASGSAPAAPGAKVS